jgi:hypothetical protein
MCARALPKVQIWLLGVESIVKAGISKIVSCKSCSSQRIIVDEWSLPSVSGTTFSKDSTKSLVVL